MRCPIAFAVLLLGAPWSDVGAQTVIQAKEDLRIDAESHDLLPIWWLWVSPKGVMVASQQQDRNFRIFAPDGRPLGTVGRNGQGPGEFRRVEGTRAGWIGDTLWLTEAGQPRLTLVGPDLKLVRMEPLPTELIGPRGETLTEAPITKPFLIGIAPDRSLLTMSLWRDGAVLPKWLPVPADHSRFFLRESRDGRMVQFLGAIPNDVTACEFGDSKGRVVVPWCPRAAMTEPLDRNRFVVVTAGASNASNGSYRVVVIDAGKGDSLLNREYRYRPVPIPSRTIDSARTALMSAKEIPPQLLQMYRKAKFPSHYPPFRNALMGRDGTIAIELYGVVKGMREWRFLDTRGNDLGVVAFPASVRLFAVEQGRAWGTDGEPGDQDSIVRYSWRAGR